MKKLLCGVLSILCLGAINLGIETLSVLASNTITNKDFFSATGGTLTASEEIDGVKLALSNVSTEIKNEDIVSVSYNNYINVSDLATGITFWNSSAINAREFEFMSIVLRDSEDPTQVMTTHLQRGDWYGNDWQLASVGLWDEYTYTYTGKQNYVYNGVATSGAAAGRERVTVNNGSYVIHDGADGMCGGGDMGSVIWGSEGTVSPFTFTFSNSTVMINNLTVANLTDAAYFEKAIANVSESEQPELYDNINATYAANLFSSGKVTMELQFGNVTDGEFDVYVQKIGNISLMGQTNSIIDNAGPVIIPQSYFNDGKYVFEKRRIYDLDKLKYKIVSVWDNIDQNPSVILEVYNQQNVKYQGNEVSFTDGDYFIITATDCYGNITTLTTKPLDLFSINLKDNYYVEISDQDVCYGVLNDLPIGYGYTTALYAGTDTEYNNPLTEENSYLFTDIGNYKIKFLVYNRDLEVATYYADLEVTDKISPTMNFSEVYKDEYSMNENVTILLPMVTDNNPNGNPTVDVKVYFDNKEVAITDGSFILSEIGTYVLEYTAKDKSNNISVERKSVVNTGADFIAPKMIFETTYAETYSVNDEISLIMPMITDNVDSSATISVEAVLNGEVLSVENDIIKPQEAGILTITYFAKDASGNQTMQQVKLTITEKTAKKSGCSGSLALGLIPIGLFGGFFMLNSLRKKRKGEENDDSKS